MAKTAKLGLEPRTAEDEVVLLVEDDEQALKLFSLYLTHGGYRVVPARTGEEALERIAEQRPSAIILDILLPLMDGWDLLSRLKAAAPTRDIPVIVVSVLEQQALGFQLGAVEYLVKPVDCRQLLRALHRCQLHRGSAEGPPTVLIGHGDPRELERLARLIDQAGYDVVRALGRRESLALAKMIRPDLIVMGGWQPMLEVIAELRAEAEMRELGIVIVTHATLTEEERAELCAKYRSTIVSGRMTRQSVLAAIDRTLREGAGRVCP